MAPTTDLKTRIDLDLDALFFELGDLSELAEIWNDEPDHRRYSELLAWNSCLSTLRLDLDPAYRSGQMAPEQQKRYRELIEKLREALPTVDALGLPRPDITLEA